MSRQARGIMAGPFPPSLAWDIMHPELERMEHEPLEGLHHRTAQRIELVSARSRRALRTSPRNRRWHRVRPPGEVAPTGHPRKVGPGAEDQLPLPRRPGAWRRVRRAEKAVAVGRGLLLQAVRR